MSIRPSLVATLVGMATLVALAGCSSSGPTTAGQSASTSNQPQVTTSAPQAPGTQANGSAGGIDVTIAAQDPTTVRPGGAPMRFSVALVNTTTIDIAQVGMVVSLGHCSCNSSGARMMPAGSMRMLNPDTNTWVPVPYDREGGGTDYINQTLVPPFVLNRGQTVTYQLELQLDTNQDFAVGSGKSAVNVTMTDVTTHKAIGVRPTASLPIAVEP